MTAVDYWDVAGVVYMDWHGHGSGRAGVSFWTMVVAFAIVIDQ